MIYKVEDLFLRIRNGMSIKQEIEVDGLPITRIETIAHAKINLERVGHAGLTREQASNYLLEDGEILFSHINSASHIGKCALYTSDIGELVHGMNLLSFKPNQNLLYPKFALYALRSQQFKDQLGKSVKKAVNQASVSIGDIKKITLSVPPLVEQKRIAAILDKAAEIKAKREQAIAKLDELVQSMFIEMFGQNIQSIDDNDFPLLSAVVAKNKIVTYGIVQAGAHVEDGVPYIKTGDIKNGKILESSLSKTSKEIAESYARSAIEAGDIVMSIRATVGTTALVPHSLNGANLTQGTARISAGNSLLPKYLICYLRTDIVQQ